MLPLQTSFDVLADAGAALDAIADEIRGAMRSTAEQFDDIPIPAGWSASAAMREAIGSAGTALGDIAGTIEMIRNAMHRAASEYAAADHRSARRHGALAW